MLDDDSHSEASPVPNRHGNGAPARHDSEGSYDSVLLNAAALQKAIFNSAMFSKIATDANGVIQIFNIGAGRMLGYKQCEVVNRISPADISDPDELIARARLLSSEFGMDIAPGFDALVFKAARGIEDIYELTYIRKDGSRFPALVSVTALRDEEDCIIGYLLIGTDNAARKQVEADQKLLDQRLRDQHFYTRSLIESNIDALITTSPTGIITDVNKQMEALTECSRDELIGAPFANYFVESARAAKAIELVLGRRKVSNYELTARSKTNRLTVLSCNSTTFYDQGQKLQGVIVAARDVTERNRIEAALVVSNGALEAARRTADLANLAKSDFLSSMSHELRSPLNAILGFAQLMAMSRPAPTDDQQESIDQILQSGWYLLELINEILDLSLIESGRLSISPEPISLHDVMTDCESMVGPQARSSGIAVEFALLGQPCFVKADRTRIKQVLINLLSNAIKYNRPGGTVEVRCSRDHAEGQSLRTTIEVRDTGEGLSPDQLAELFQPFNRLGREGGAIEGTGIGLVVSKRLVDLMGGTLSVRSTKGVGSVFTVELPSADEAELKCGHTADSQFNRLYPENADNQRTLLCVEDNPANLALVTRLMRWRPDLRLLTASDGMAGVESAFMSIPDVILMDINLPDISGSMALSLLQKNPETAAIPVIALSANAMPKDIQRGLDAGFFRYLTKPIKVDELMETIDAALDAAHLGRSARIQKAERHDS